MPAVLRARVGVAPRITAAALICCGLFASCASSSSKTREVPGTSISPAATDAPSSTVIAGTTTTTQPPTPSSVAENPTLTNASDGSAAPSGDFYTPPDPLPLAPPGGLIRFEAVTDLPLDPPATVWRILYHSRSADDHDIAVSGYVLIPVAAAPGGIRPVYAWAHGTVGLGDQCAPSRHIRESLPPFGGQQVDAGAIVVATDYEGLGTPGLPTQAVGVSLAHTILDGVRAAAALPNVGTLGDVLVAGHSEGGQAALFAAQLAPSYAPELSLNGVVALAPGGDLVSLVDYLSTSSYKGAVLIGAVGLQAAYPSLDLSTSLAPTAIADLPRVETECVDDTVGRYRDLDPDQVLRASLSSEPDVVLLLQKNSPGADTISVPVFIGQGADDQQTPSGLSEALAQKYCAMGVQVTRTVYADTDHDGVVDAANDDALAFIADRYTHQPATSNCA